MLVDLRPFGVTGKVAQEALDRAGITCNKNAIPNDPEKPFTTSGLRLGTAAVTTAGMQEAEMQQISHLIAASAAQSRRRPHRRRSQGPSRRPLLALHPLSRKRVKGGNEERDQAWGGGADERR